LTEGVGEDVIKKAIENHEWIYLYYNADNEEGKNASGNEFADIHKATFPLYLPENIITNFSKKNANIFLFLFKSNLMFKKHFHTKTLIC
jgi:hypothetical protein